MSNLSGINVGDGRSQESELTLDLEDGDTKYFTGNNSAVSAEFNALTGGSKTSESQWIEIIEAVLAGGVDGVEIGDLDCAGITLKLSGNGATDTIRLNIDMDQFDTNNGFGGNLGDAKGGFNVVSATDNTKESKIIGTKKNGASTELELGVGGSAKGESDYKKLFEKGLEGLDENGQGVELLDVGDDHFTIKVVNARGAEDIFLVKDAGGIIDDVLGSGGWFDLQNSNDQTVFVDEGVSQNKTIGTKGSLLGIDGFGEQIKVNDIPELEDVSATNDKVTLTELGDINILELSGNGGSTDTIVYDVDAIA